jgi:hypothetical protein
VGTTATGAQQTISPGTSGQILKSNGAAALATFQTGAPADVALGNVDNTSDATKNAATATLTNKTLTNPLFTGNAGLPGTPATGLGRLYGAGTTNLSLRFMNETGTEIDITGGLGSWTTWTPTWTNLTLGNGVLNAKYTKIGKTVCLFLQLVWGTTTSASGAVQFSLPLTAAAQYGTLAGIGAGFAEDTGVGGYPLLVHVTSTTTARLQAQNSAGTYVTDAAVSNTVPFTWGNGDKYSCSFTYESA